MVTESINSVIAQNNQENENLESINAIITKEKEEIKKQLDELKEQMKAISQQRYPFQNYQNHQNIQAHTPPPYYGTYNAPPWQRGNNRRRNNSNYKYVGNGRYCWTHGACDHWGRYCKSKADGHIDEATFRDTKGGSMRGVRT